MNGLLRLVRWMGLALGATLWLAWVGAAHPAPVGGSTCGNGVCEAGESLIGCPLDCGILLWGEDFEDGQAQGWMYDPAGWNITTEGTNHVWRTTSQAYAQTDGTDELMWLVRARRVNSDANLGFRIYGPNNYALRLEAARLVLWTERNGYGQDLAVANASIGTAWHTYRIQAVGHQIDIWLDNAPVLSLTDSAAGSLRGNIGLEAYQDDGARFDDMRLYRLSPQCYNNLKDGDETGIDCGGSCPIQDCCRNRAWDTGLGEGGVDCGGSCSLACQPSERLDRWTQTNGPWLEYIRRIRFDPDDPNTIFASSNTGSGVIKSIDGGYTWNDISDGISPMNVFGLAMDPVDKRILYAGTANGRVFTSVNGGASWQLLWQYTDVDDAIWTLEVDPSNRDRLFAGMGDYTGADGRLYRSEDRGQTWSKVLDVNPANAWDNGFISSMAFDPSNPARMYVTTGIGDWCGGGNPGDPNPVGFGIYRSVDHGATWKAINTGLQDLTVSHLVINPSAPQTLYAGVGCVDDNIQLTGNVFKSIDGGDHWQKLEGVAPLQTVTRLALYPGQPNKVYALGHGGIYYSADSGATWSRWDETIKAAIHTFVYEHVFFPGNPQKMLIGTYSGGVIHSLDEGRNWFELNGVRHSGEVLGNSYGTALDPNDPDTIYATTIGGMFKTENGGETWRFIGQGIFQHLRQVALAPSDPQRLYLGGDSQNFYTSSDGGESWTRLDLGASRPGPAAPAFPPGSDVQFMDIAVDPLHPNRVAVAVSNYPSWPLLHSSDYGQTWQAPTLGFQAQAYSLAFDPVTAGRVYAGLGWNPGQPRLLRSDDSGQSWQDAAPGLSLLTVYQMAQANGIIRAATNGSGVFTRWPGDPVVWENTGYVSAGNWLAYVTRLVTDGRDPADFLAFDKSDRRVYRLVEGSPWQPVLALAGESDEVTDLAYHPTDPSLAYATTRQSGVWHSTNGGGSWVSSTKGLPAGASLRGLAVDTGGTVYAGSLGAPAQLYRSQDGGVGWAPLNSQFNFSTIHAFAADPVDPRVAYAAAWGGGVWKTGDGGLSWVRLTEAPVSAAGLAIHPKDHHMLYAADRTQPVLWQSADGGQHWWRRFHAGAGYTRLQALAVDPHNPDTVYVSAFKAGAYGAEGSLFQVSPTGYADVTGSLPRVVISLAVSPSQPGLLLASTHIYGLYRSTDGGSTWQVVSGGLPKVGFNALAWDPATGVLWGGACSGSFPDTLRPPGLVNGDDQPGVYTSSDGGLTWKKRLAGVVGKGFAFKAGTIYAAAGNAVYLSRDGGVNWSIQGGGPPLSPAAVAAGGDRLYIATLGGGVHTALIQVDRSLAWQGSHGPYPQVYAIQLLAQPGALYATAFPGGVFKSLDGGQHWSEANFGLPGFSLPDPARNGYYALAANPTNPDNLYLGIYGYGVYRSDDGAATWLAANTGLGNRYIYSLLVEQDGGAVWAATNDGIQSLWRATTGSPGRLSWTAAPDSPPSSQAITGIVINPENPKQISIAAFPAGVFTTPDSGTHWYERSNNLAIAKRRTHGTGYEDGYNQLAQDPLNPRHLFFGTYGGQLYETRDSGQSWVDFSTGLMREGAIYGIEMDPFGRRMYVSQKAGGVSRRALDPAAPQVRVVAPGGMSAACSGGDHFYTSVAAALAQAHPGDRVIVCPGRYAERVTLDQAIWLEAFAGLGQTRLVGVNVTANGARLAGFWLKELNVSPGVQADLLGNLVVRAEIFLPVIRGGR